MIHVQNANKPAFSMRRLKVAGIAAATVAALVPSMANAVAIYFKGVGYCGDWEGSLESCNRWSESSPEIVCMPDGSLLSTPGGGATVIERNAKGEVTIVAGRQRFAYVIFSAEGKLALKAVGKGSSRSAFDKAIAKAYATSTRIIPAAKANALAAQYKVRIVQVGPR